jgi:hypothetical protein
MKTLLLGYGEVGKAVYENLKDSHEIDIIDLKFKQKSPLRELDDNQVLLVTIPFTDKFIKTVQEYQDKIKPKATIIFSTVAIGTCRKLNAVHSPIEGKHPDLTQSFKIHKRWLGGHNQVASQFFWNAGIKLMQVTEPEHTEFLKLRSTSLYGLNIEFARYSSDVAKKLNMPFELTKNYDEDYNELYEKLGLKQFQRYILDAPQGKIGGHCITPNALILDKQYPSVFLKEIYLPD